jgi:hypothetical protein
MNNSEPVYLKDYSQEKFEKQYAELLSKVSKVDTQQVSNRIAHFDYASRYKNVSNGIFTNLFAIIIDEKSEPFSSTITNVDLFKERVDILFRLYWNEDKTTIVQLDVIEDIIGKYLRIEQLDKDYRTLKEYNYQIKGIKELKIISHELVYEASISLKVEKIEQ